MNTPQTDSPSCSYSVTTEVETDVADDCWEDIVDDDSDESFPTPRSMIKNTNFQNRRDWPNLVRMVERFQISDREGAAIANATLTEIGYLSKKSTKFIVCKNKLRRERQKYRKEIRQQEAEFFKLVDGLYFDGRKDSTLTTLTADNGKEYQGCVLGEHCVVVGELGSY